MQLIRIQSIKQKLTLIIMAVSAIAVLLACSGGGVYEVIAFRRQMSAELTSHAKVIGTNLTAALVFDDTFSAEETLGALKAIPDIRAAVVYSKSGRVFATYRKVGGAERFSAPEIAIDGYRFADGNLHIFQSIMLEGEPVGTVYIKAGLGELYRRLRYYGGMAAGIMLVSCCVAYLLSTRLQRVISAPIEHLAHTAETVSSEGNYSMRAVKMTSDETGLLIDSFNAMLSQIQARDSALQQARSELEDRVEERTEELQRAAVELQQSNRMLHEEITERTKMAAALRDSETTLRAMAGSAHDAVIMMDGADRISFWNDAATRTFGFSADEAFGRNLHELLVPRRYREAVQAGLRAFRQTGTGSVVGKTQELDAVKKDGSEFSLEIAISSVMIKGEWHAIGIARDITERKQAEEAMRQAKNAAEAATQAKSDFLANMSHEIRTPMNAVVGMTGLLLDTGLTPEQQEYAETARNSCDTLLTIINDILDFSKIEAGKLEVERQPFDLCECVEESLDLVASKAAGKGLDLAYLMEDDAPSMLEGDVTRVRQVLVNLLNNAVKFTEKGEVVLSVSAHPVSANGDGQSAAGQSVGGQLSVIGAMHEVHFSVRDTGIGIPANRAERLFKSFSQVDNSTTRQYGGTGLGLAISKRLSELMGGKIWVESEVGRGSTFHFTIVAKTQESLKSAERRVPTAELRGRRVLIVDDNATNRLILTRQTQTWGMAPWTAATASEALGWITWGEPFDLAILDVQMPEMDGITLAERIRTHRDEAQLPIIMLTSLGRREGGADNVQCSAFLSKPVKPTQLFDVITSVLAPGSCESHKPAKVSTLDGEMGRQRPLRILLVEDNAINQKVATRILQRIGYRADLAANGLEAVAAVARQQYDIILMDVQMPEMDGLEATRRIREEELAGEHTWIVAMTASAMLEDREACFAVGMDDYVSKPVRVEELQAALGRCRSPDTENPEAPRYAIQA